MKRADLVIGISSVILGVSIVAAGCSVLPEDLKPRTDRFDTYDKEELIECLGSEFGSTLLVFPDSADKALEVAFEGEIYTDDEERNGYALLSCTYAPEDYEAEVSRLSGLTYSLKNGSEILTHEVLYDDESYRFPAYVAVDGYMDVYEYALTDESDHTIYYVLLCSPPGGRCEGLEGYMKTDLSAYESVTAESAEDDGRYSIYVWHFDT